LLLGLLMGLGLKVHVGHVLGLKHDLGLGVDPSYKPCWDHIRLSGEFREKMKFVAFDIWLL